MSQFDMDTAFEWISANTYWLFSGLGVAVIIFVLERLWRNRKSTSPTIHQENLRAGGDIAAGDISKKTVNKHKTPN